MVSTRHANFPNIRTLTHTPPAPICYFGWLCMLCRFGSGAPHLWKRRGMGRGGRRRVHRSHDRCISYQTAAAASWWHLETSITAEQDKPHKETTEGRVGAELKLHTIGTHCSCCGMTETRCSRQCFNLNFLTFSVPDQPNSWLTPFVPLRSHWHLQRWRRSVAPELTPRNRRTVWFGLMSVFWWLGPIKETAGFKVTTLVEWFNINIRRAAYSPSSFILSCSHKEAAKPTQWIHSSLFQLQSNQCGLV